MQHFVLLLRFLAGHSILLLHVTSRPLSHSQRTPEQSSEVPQHEARVHGVPQRVEALVSFAIAKHRGSKILIGQKAANQIARLQIPPSFVQNARVRRRRRGQKRQSQSEKREPRVGRKNGGDLGMALNSKSPRDSTLVNR